MDVFDLGQDPFTAFTQWFDEVQRTGIPNPEAMALATATADGRPSVRMVLLKGVDARGFSFFTNYESRKSSELDGNPRAALLFHWDRLERQVRLEGRVERTSGAESDAYFATRPYESRLAAWASPQSRPLESRHTLLAEVERLKAKWPEPGPVPRPPFWGGYRLVPERFEFWQGRASRLHDRVVCTPAPDGRWSWVRLGP